MEISRMVTMIRRFVTGRWCLLFMFVLGIGVKGNAQVNVDSLRRVISQRLEIEKRAFEGDSLGMMFYVDTALIQRVERARLDEDYSTAGMANIIYDSEVAYDVLLNKYYGMLRTRMEKKDREVLVQAQRAWVQFRDDELKLNALLQEDKYSGGGTIRILYRASAALELTKNRVLELYAYLKEIL